jgi:FKBP-type peptidyl-prolyl cis-trans isomerase FkpA
MNRLCGPIVLVTLALAAGCGEPAAEKDLKEQSGVKYEDLKVGDGAEVKEGDWVKVHYTGWLQENGKKFDSSLDPGKQPFVFQHGGGMVIQGWDRGVAGMKVGGKRVLHIPSQLGYGVSGEPRGGIPPNADLKFEVEVLSIEKGPPPRGFGDE